MTKQANKIFSDPILLAEINQYARQRTFKKGENLIAPGDEILFIPIVLSGSIRVLRSDSEGNEVFLYYLYPGQTCAMSVTCCQAGKKSLVRAVAEDETEVLQIPVQLAGEWYKYNEWKAYISNNYSNRFAELLEVIDLIAFNHMDKQLLHYLQERCKALGNKTLEITHQEIADELHTHREAISRLLRSMEKQKLVVLSRNSIQLLA